MIAEINRTQEINKSQDVEDDPEEIEVRKFIYYGTLYLIDDNDNIYDYHSHEEIGKWNNARTQIERI